MFTTSLENETENEQGDGGIVWFHLSNGFVINIFRTYVLIPKNGIGVFFQMINPPNLGIGSFSKCFILDTPLQSC